MTNKNCQYFDIKVKNSRYSFLSFSLVFIKNFFCLFYKGKNKSENKEESIYNANRKMIEEKIS